MDLLFSRQNEQEERLLFFSSTNPNVPSQITNSTNSNSTELKESQNKQKEAEGNKETKNPEEILSDAQKAVTEGVKPLAEAAQTVTSVLGEDAKAVGNTLPQSIVDAGKTIAQNLKNQQEKAGRSKGKAEKPSDKLQIDSQGETSPEATSVNFDRLIEQYNQIKEMSYKNSDGSLEPVGAETVRGQAEVLIGEMDAKIAEAIEKNDGEAQAALEHYKGELQKMIEEISRLQKESQTANQPPKPEQETPSEPEQAPAGQNEQQASGGPAESQEVLKQKHKMINDFRRGTPYRAGPDREPNDKFRDSYEKEAVEDYLPENLQQIHREYLRNLPPQADKVFKDFGKDYVDTYNQLCAAGHEQVWNDYLRNWGKDAFEERTIKGKNICTYQHSKDFLKDLENNGPADAYELIKKLEDKVEDNDTMRGICEDIHRIYAGGKPIHYGPEAAGGPAREGKKGAAPGGIGLETGKDKGTKAEFVSYREGGEREKQNQERNNRQMRRDLMDALKNGDIQKAREIFRDIVKGIREEKQEDRQEHREARRERLENRLNDVEEQIDEVKEEIRPLREEIAELKQEIENIENNNKLSDDKKERRIARREAEIQELREELKPLREKLGDLREKRERIQKKLDELEESEEGEGEEKEKGKEKNKDDKEGKEKETEKPRLNQKRREIARLLKGKFEDFDGSNVTLEKNEDDGTASLSIDLSGIRKIRKVKNMLQKAGLDKNKKVFSSENMEKGELSDLMDEIIDELEGEETEERGEGGANKETEETDTQDKKEERVVV